MTYRILSLGLLGVMFLSACASGEVAGGDGQDGRGRIEVAAVWTGAERESFEAVLDAFTEKTGVETSYRSSGDDIGAFLGTQIEGNNPPDIALIPQPGLLKDLAERGALEPASEEATRRLEENYGPIWKQLGSVDGSLYGIYFKAANKSTWWYNTDVLEQAGVQPPQDWREMLKTAETVKDSGTPWVSIAGADGWTLTDWFENIYIRTAGPKMYDKLADHRIEWSHPSVIDALNTFAELLKKDGYVADEALQTDFTSSVTQVFSDPPRAATVYEGDFVVGVIRSETSATTEDFGFFDFPSITGSSPAVISGGDAAVALTDAPGAQAFLEFLATPEAAEVWAARGGFVSPNQNLDLSVYPSESARQVARSLIEAQTVRFDLSDLQPAEFGATTGQGLLKLFQDFLSDPAHARRVARQMERAADSAYGA